MRTHTFGRAVMPALASDGAVTRLAAGSFDEANEPTGVDVWEWPVGHVDQARPVAGISGAFRGDPALSPDAQLLAFFDAGARLQVIRIDSGEVVFSGPVVVGNYGIKLRNDTVVYQTAVHPSAPGTHPDDGVYEQPLAGGPRRKIRAFSATGLAYLTDTGVVTWEENRIAHDPIGVPAFAGPLVLGIGYHTGGLLARLPGEALREFDRGAPWNDPAACAEGETFALAAWWPLRELRVWCVSPGEILAWPRYVAPGQQPPLTPTPTPTPAPAPDPTPEPQPKPEDPVFDDRPARALIDRIAREVDRERPGLRSNNLPEYQRIVCGRCHVIDPHVGRKSNHGTTIGISNAALGIRYDLSADTSQRVLMTAYDYVRDETTVGPEEWRDRNDRNQLRPEPLVHPNERQYWIKPEAVEGGDQDDPGDTDPRPGPGPVEDPALLPVVQELAAAALQLDIAAVRLDASIAALRAVKRAPTPEPHECPAPRWPDDHECPAAPPAFGMSEPEVQALMQTWTSALRRSMPPDLLTFLLYRLIAEHASPEELLEEVHRRRG